MLIITISDWIAVNVLRTVALSTNSVAASVEPMMHQQYYSMSPMAGQESFGATMDGRSSHTGMLAQTPTSSTMLAALQQQDPFPVGSLDSTGFATDAYGSMGYMDTSVVPDDAAHQAAMGYGGDFGASFDSQSFGAPQELGSALGSASVSAVGTPASVGESEHLDPDAGKSDLQGQGQA